MCNALEHSLINDTVPRHRLWFRQQCRDVRDYHSSHETCNKALFIVTGQEDQHPIIHSDDIKITPKLLVAYEKQKTM